MSSEFITLLMFSGLLICIILGLPLAFSLGGIGLVFAFFLWGPDAITMVVFRAFQWSTNIIVMAVPLFVAMGLFLEKAGVADYLYEMMYRWSGRFRGGLAMGTVLICTLFAAMTGITAAATVTMGLIALPSMLNRGYDKNIALGTIASGGTLGILIPPSVMMIVLSLILRESVGRLFAGGIVPGLIISFLLCAYIGIRAFFQPKLCPASEVKYTWRQKISSLVAVIAPIILILAVLGGIFGGIATPTEAAAVGAFGAFLCVLGYRRFSWQLVKGVCYDTLRISCMVIWIIIGAQAFISTYTAVGGADFIRDLVLGLEVGPWPIFIGILGILFIMGMFLDTMGIIMLAGPILCPIVAALGFDSLWFGVIFIIVLCMGYITPPFGWNLFYLKGVVPPGITMGDIIHSIWPFLGMMILGLIIVLIFPQTVFWLPSIMLR